jgi:hypothetical protein
MLLDVNSTGPVATALRRLVGAAWGLPADTAICLEGETHAAYVAALLAIEHHAQQVAADAIDERAQVEGSAV